MEDRLKNLLKRIDKLQKQLQENSTDVEKCKKFNDVLEFLKNILNGKANKPEEKLKKLEQRLTEIEKAANLHTTGRTDRNRNDTPINSSANTNNNDSSGQEDRFVTNANSQDVNKRNRNGSPVDCVSIDLTDDDHSFVENHNRLQKYLEKRGACTDEDIEAFSRNFATASSIIYGPSLPLPIMNICNAVPMVTDNTRGFPSTTEKLSTYLEKVIGQQSTSEIPVVTEIMSQQSTSAVAAEMVVEEKKCPLDNFDLSEIREILKNSKNNQNNNATNDANELNRISTETEEPPSVSENNPTNEPEELNKTAAGANESSSEETSFEIDMFAEEDPVFPTIKKSGNFQPTNDTLHTSEKNDVIECVDMVISDSSSETSPPRNSVPVSTEGALQNPRTQIRFNFIPTSVKKSPLIRTAMSSSNSVASEKGSVDRTDSANVINSKETTVSEFPPLPVPPPSKPFIPAPVPPPMHSKPVSIPSSVPSESTPVPPPMPSEPPPLPPPVPLEPAPESPPLSSPVQEAVTPDIRSQTKKRISKVSPVEKPATVVSARARLIQSLPEVHKLGEPGKVSGALKLLRTDLLTQSTSKQSSVQVECDSNPSSSSHFNAVKNVSVRSDPPTNNIPFTHPRDPRRAAGIVPRAPIQQPNFGRSGQSDFARSPSQPNVGRSPQQPHFGRSPSQPDFGSSSQQPNVGRSPSQPEFGRSPPQTEISRTSSQSQFRNSHSSVQTQYRRSPSQPEYGNCSPNRPNYGNRPCNQLESGSRSPSQSDYVYRTSIQTSYDNYSPSQTSYGNRSPRQPSYGNRSPSQPSYGNRSPSQPNYGNRSPSRTSYDDRSPSRTSYDVRSPSQTSYGNRSPSQPSYGNRSPSRTSYDDRSPSQTSYGNRSPSQTSYDVRSPSQTSYGNHSPIRTSYDNRSPSPPNDSNRSPTQPNKGYRSPTLPYYQTPNKPDFGEPSQPSSTKERKFPSSKLSHEPASLQKQKCGRGSSYGEGASRGAQGIRNQRPTRRDRPQASAATAKIEDIALQDIYGTGSRLQYKIPKIQNLEITRDNDNCDTVIQSSATEENCDTILSSSNVTSNTEEENWDDIITQPGSSTYTMITSPRTVSVSSQLLPKIVATNSLDDEKWNDTPTASSPPSLDDRSCGNEIGQSGSTRMESPSNAAKKLENSDPEYSPPSPVVCDKSLEPNRDWDEESTDPAPSSDEDESSEKGSKFVKTAESGRINPKDIVTVPLLSSDEGESDDRIMKKEKRRVVNHSVRTDVTSIKPTNCVEQSSVSIDLTDEPVMDKPPPIVKDEIIEIEDDSDVDEKHQVENIPLYVDKSKTIQSVHTSEAKRSVNSETSQSPNKPSTSQKGEKSGSDQKAKIEGRQPRYKGIEKFVRKKRDKLNSKESKLSVNICSQNEGLEVNPEMSSNNDASSKKKRGQPKKESGITKRKSSSPDTDKKPAKHPKKTRNTELSRLQKDLFMSEHTKRSVSHLTGKRSCTVRQPANYIEDPLKGYILEEKIPIRRQTSVTKSSTLYYQPAYDSTMGQEILAEEPCSSGSLLQGEGATSSITDIVELSSSTVQQSANYTDDLPKSSGEKVEVKSRKSSEDLPTPCSKTVSSIKMKQNIAEETPCCSKSILQQEETRLINKKDITVAKTFTCQNVLKKKNDAPVMKQCGNTTEINVVNLLEKMKTTKIAVELPLLKLNDNVSYSANNTNTTNNKNEGKFGCSLCPYTARSNNDLTNHEKSCHWSINCIFCDKVLYGSEGLKQHFQNKVVNKVECVLVQKKVLFLCPYCPYCTSGVTYDRYLFLEKHVLVDHFKKTMPTIKIRFADKERDLFEYELAMMQSEWNTEIVDQAKSFEVEIPRTVKIRNVAIKSTARVKRSEIKSLQKKCGATS